MEVRIGRNSSRKSSGLSRALSKVRVERDPAWDHPALVEERKAKIKASIERQIRAPFHTRSVLTQLGIFVFVLALWQVPIVNPIKLLVVLFHEMSHVAVAHLTGGTVFGIAIDPGGAGVTLGMGGSETLIVLAGYAGSFAVGCALYVLMAIWRPADVWFCLAALSCVSLTLGWLNDFTAAFGVGAILVLFAGVVFFKPGVKKFLLTVTATTSCLYPLIDVAGEYIKAENTGFVVHGRTASSDVSQLASLTGLPESSLAILFCGAGAIAVIYLIDWTARKDAATHIKHCVRLPWQAPRRRKSRFRDELYDPGDPLSVREYVLR